MLRNGGKAREVPRDNRLAPGLEIFRLVVNPTLVEGRRLGAAAHRSTELTEDMGTLLAAVTFLMFGVVLLGDSLARIDLETLVDKRTAGLMQDHLREWIENATRREFPNGIDRYGAGSDIGEGSPDTDRPTT